MSVDSHTLQMSSCNTDTFDAGDSLNSVRVLPPVSSTLSTRTRASRRHQMTLHLGTPAS
jgi:hypothetical protein